MFGKLWVYLIRYPLIARLVDPPASFHSFGDVIYCSFCICCKCQILAYDDAIYYGFTAQALGDPTVTIEEVTPPVFTSGPLFPIEVHILYPFIGGIVLL